MVSYLIFFVVYWVWDVRCEIWDILFVFRSHFFTSNFVRYSCPLRVSRRGPWGSFRSKYL